MRLGPANNDNHFRGRVAHAGNAPAQPSSLHAKPFASIANESTHTAAARSLRRLRSHQMSSYLRLGLAAAESDTSRKRCPQGVRRLPRMKSQTCYRMTGPVCISETA